MATALKPLLAFFARGTRLKGGNHGVKKCDSVDPLSLVIKCLWGGGTRVGELDSTDVRQMALSPWRPSQHTHTLFVSAAIHFLIIGSRESGNRNVFLFPLLESLSVVNSGQ